MPHFGTVFDFHAEIQIWKWWFFPRGSASSRLAACTASFSLNIQILEFCSSLYLIQIRLLVNSHSHIIISEPLLKYIVNKHFVLSSLSSSIFLHKPEEPKWALFIFQTHSNVTLYMSFFMWRGHKYTGVEITRGRVLWKGWESLI